MIYTRKKFRVGLTLVELILSTVIGGIIAMLVSVVLVAGHRNWLSAFNNANSGIEVDSYTTVITFGATGRMSNKRDYCIYKVSKSGTYAPAQPPQSNPVAVVDGNAVEFRYWDVPLDTSLIDVTKTGTKYRLFYLNGDKLMMDEGPYPPGGVSISGSRITGADIVSQHLASNVAGLQFSHTSKAAVPDNQNNTPGDGSIRMVISFTDRNDNNKIITVKADTFMRNVWP